MYLFVFLRFCCSICSTRIFKKTYQNHRFQPLSSSKTDSSRKIVQDTPNERSRGRDLAPFRSRNVLGAFWCVFTHPYTRVVIYVVLSLSRLRFRFYSFLRHLTMLDAVLMIFDTVLMMLDVALTISDTVLSI